MKKWIKEILIGAVLVFILSNIISYLRKPELDSSQLPTATVQLVDGTSYRLKKGQPVMIHFWATWCRTCKMEAANIEHVSKKYEVLTIAVKSGDDGKIKRYLREKGLSFRVLNDAEGSWAQAFRVKAFPTTFIYDGKGELKFTEVGYTTTAGLLARMALVE
ncbi:redoxin family protein [Sulfurovum riftiae]|uniref:Thioredoxin n=1 Tax=Sulfurovum riftiae TaxID=1630136 RepID=A0A151CGB0_9BACT|nr:redoxin family protein [Sulfurovum riftiae]KYJ86582.1 thioredoxin [Sulfurovum riftiae]